MQIPGISGMVRVDDNSYLLVHDGKGPNKPRLGRLEVRANFKVKNESRNLAGVAVAEQKGFRVDYEEIRIERWPLTEDIPNDLEGICQVPGKPHEYFLVESGFYPKFGKFGRVIRVAFVDKNGKPSLKGVCPVSYTHLTLPTICSV